MATWRGFISLGKFGFETIDCDFYFFLLTSRYTDADGKKQIMASTQFEALDARRALPCWDEPAVKATFEVIMVVPNALTAISNMPEITTQHLANGKKRIVFAMSPKVSIIIVGFIIASSSS